MPALAGTEPWGRRLLNTQLASWAGLRHDTLLYVKQSYTGRASCEFPDAYLELYPELFAGLAAFALHGEMLINDLAVDQDSIKQVSSYFNRLYQITTMLQEMATHQRSGAPHTAEHMAFINDAVTITDGCVVGIDGWYADLLYDSESTLEYDPTIADVHTQPTDQAGNVVGKVLHVATDRPRLMVVSADTCSGPRVYAGLASSYFEHTTADFERLTDEQWSSMGRKTDVPWMQDLVVP